MPSLRVLTLMLATVSLVAGCTGGSEAEPTSGSADAGEVAVSVTSCGTGWDDAPAGRQRLVLHNTDSRPGEVLLVDDKGAVYADAEPLGPGTRTTLDIRLAAGRYAIRCLMEDEAAVSGPSVDVRGTTDHAAPGVRPVSQADLVAPTKVYERYVAAHLGPLAARVDAMRHDIARGDLASARRDWLRAHLAYERLGAAYDAFGDLDGAINGLPDAFPDGVDDPAWTGFHRVELGLWRDQRTRPLLEAADILAADVERLGQQFATAQIDPLTMAIRAHEISENALQFELTGRTDFGSHSSLLTVGANLAGTITVLRILRPLLASRLSDLHGLEQAVRQARTLVRAAPGGLVSELPRRRRERIDAAVSELCERLAPVASILEPRRTS